MGAHASNLKAAGYNMVCATSQDAINDALMEYLASSTNAEFTACYRKGADGAVVPTTLAEVVSAIGHDPFSVAPGDPAVQRMNDWGFLMAFKAKLGMPRPRPGAPAPPPLIILDQGASAVTCQHYFTEFSLVWVDYTDHRYVWGPVGPSTLHKFTQDPAHPLIFTSIANLGVRDAALSELPQAARDAITNLNPNTMFGVKQILLSLVGGSARWTGFNGMSDLSMAWRALPECVADQYWKHLPGGAAVIGHGVHATTPQPASSIIPTDVTFRISPNLAGDGTPSGNFSLYTLDYLVMTGGRGMPTPAPFGWDWMTASDNESDDGVMSIDRDTFRETIRAIINPAAAPLSIDLLLSEPNGVQYLGFANSPTPAQWRVFDPSLPFGVKNSFDGNLTPVLVINYEHTVTSQGSVLSSLSSLFGAASGNKISKCTYSLNGFVAFGGRTIRMQVGCVAAAYTGLGFVARGNFIDYILIVDYDIGVAADGKLKVTPRDPVIASDPTDHGSGWTPVGMTISSFQWDFQTVLLTAIHGLEDSIAHALNGVGAWVFPGGKTFMFKDVSFSDNEDLVVHLSYKAPR